jgi:hypothetical protein
MQFRTISTVISQNPYTPSKNLMPDEVRYLSVSSSKLEAGALTAIHCLQRCEQQHRGMSLVHAFGQSHRLFPAEGDPH